jgi:hypothetical protein
MIITKRKRIYHRRYEKISPSARGLTNRKKKEEEGRRSQFEPMIDYKYPTIASGATPIGSAKRTPDRKLDNQVKKATSHSTFRRP